MDGLRALLTVAAAAVVFLRVRDYAPEPIWIALAVAAVVWWFLREKMQGDFLAILTAGAIIYIGLQLGSGTIGLPL